MIEWSLINGGELEAEYLRYIKEQKGTEYKSNSSSPLILWYILHQSPHDYSNVAIFDVPHYYRFILNSEDSVKAGSKMNFCLACFE